MAVSLKFPKKYDNCVRKVCIGLLCYQSRITEVNLNYFGGLEVKLGKDFCFSTKSTKLKDFN